MRGGGARGNAETRGNPSSAPQLPLLSLSFILEKFEFIGSTAPERM
jgi:hypothetical protein